jgi:hypothetical protein
MPFLIAALKSSSFQGTMNLGISLESDTTLMKCFDSTRESTTKHIKQSYLAYQNSDDIDWTKTR